MSEENRYEQDLRTDLDEETADKPSGMALHTKILIGLLIGVIGRNCRRQSETFLTSFWLLQFRLTDNGVDI